MDTDCVTTHTTRPEDDHLEVELAHGQGVIWFTCADAETLENKAIRLHECFGDKLQRVVVQENGERRELLDVIHTQSATHEDTDRRLIAEIHDRWRRHGGAYGHDGIPYCPEYVYRVSGEWRGWNDFLGSEAEANLIRDELEDRAFSQWA